MAQTRIALAAIFAASIVTASPALAQQQGFRLDSYLAPPTTEDGLALQHPGTLGHLRWSAGLMLDYAHGSLVIEDSGGNTGAIVDHLLAGHVVGALGLAELIEIHLRFPVVLVQTGESPSFGGMTFQSPDTVALSDSAVGASVRFYGDENDGFAIGMAGELMIPMSGDSTLASDTEVGARGHVMASIAMPRVIRVVLNAGAAYRPERDYLDARIGSELNYGLGVYVPIIPELTVLGELWGSTRFREDQVFSARGTPLELLLGARLTIEGVSISAGIGAGLTQAVGTPDVRALLGVGYAPPLTPEEVAARAVGDRDRDGILDDVDQCPDEPEDIDEFEDENGCPDPDNDQDGILDDPDECPMEAEDTDGFEDENGCPDPDNDRDGIPDATDGCPLEPEDADGFEDADGCPDNDNDRDGFSDTIDRCRDEPETANGFEDDDGCPDTEPALVDLNALGMRVLFPHNRDRPTGPSRRVLRAVATLINQHPEWQRIQLEAHTDTSGEEEYNVELSRRRAERVREALVRLRVNADRLVLVAHGEAAPEVQETDEAAAAQNRRVVFTILQRETDRAAPE